jgi:hypothetical protein
VLKAEADAATRARTRARTMSDCVEERGIQNMHVMV